MESTEITDQHFADCLGIDLREVTPEFYQALWVINLLVRKKLL